jgi:anthranilate/para-aminobenzoate synthase component I
LVGHISYDAITHLEPVPLPPQEMMKAPQMAFLRVDSLVVLDNLKGQLFIVSRNPSGETWAQEIEERLQAPLEDLTPSLARKQNFRVDNVTSISYFQKKRVG